MPEVLEHGGDVTVEGAPHIETADRIEILDCGMVKLIWKTQYKKSYFPAERVEIHTHTSDDEESAEWW